MRLVEGARGAGTRGYLWSTQCSLQEGMSVLFRAVSAVLCRWLYCCGAHEHRCFHGFFSNSGYYAMACVQERHT